MVLLPNLTSCELITTNCELIASVLESLSSLTHPLVMFTNLTSKSNNYECLGVWVTIYPIGIHKTIGKTI